MIIRERIASKAREWLGTPYHHHQRQIDLGVDCLGLLIAIAEDLDIGGAYSETSFTPYKGYSRNPNPNKMLKGMQAFLKPLSGEGMIGDICLIETRPGLPAHLGIKVTDTTIIHACAVARKVIEVPIPHNINSWWQYGGLE